MKMNKTQWTWLIFLGLVSACSDNKNTIENTAPLLQVDYMIAQLSETDNVISIPGSIVPFEHVDLYPEISGRLLSIHFSEGQTVKKRQLLFKLDTDLQEAQLKQVQSDLAFAKKDEQRKKALWEAKSISLEDYEMSQAKKMNLEAQVDVLRVQIEKGRITAPFSGTIGLRAISEGAFITSTTKLTNIAQNDRVKIDFAIGEHYAPTVKIGEEIEFSFAKDSVKHIAKIYASEPTINTQTRMLTVRAEVKKNTNFFPGTFVEIIYNLGVQENSILVPATALVPVLNGQKIWKIKNGLATGIMVEPGLRSKQDVQVFGDINPGDTLILSGLLAMREGMNVTIKQR